MPDFNPFSGGLATEAPTLTPAPAAGGFDPFATGRAEVSAEPVATNPSDRWNTLYGGLDGIDQRVDGDQRAAFASMDKVVKDPKDARARAVNQSFVSTNYGLHGPWVEQNWDSVKVALAEKEFGVKDAAVDERWLYGKIAERLGAAGKGEQNFQPEIKPWTWQDGLSEDWRVVSKASGKFWESIWRPFKELPAPPADLPDVWSMDEGLFPTNPAVAAGLYSGLVKPLLESIESPAGIATFGIGGGLKAAKDAGVPGAKLALAGMSGFFATLMGYATVKATPEAIRTAFNPNASTQEKVEALSGVAGTAAMTLLAGIGAAMELLPDKGAKLGKDLEGKTTAESAERLRQEAVVAKTPEAADALNKAAAQLDEFSFAAGQPESDFRRVAGEKIAAAAVRLPDGTVVEGASHDAIREEITAPAEPIVEKAEDLGLEAKVETGAEEGFTTTTGRFVTREEAADIAEHQGQMKPEPVATEENPPAAPSDPTPTKPKDGPLQADQVEMEPTTEFPRSSFGQTSLKNAYGELEREAYGFDAAPPSEQRSMTEAWARAAAITERNPKAGEELAERLSNDPNVGLTDDQSALLLRHKVDLQRALNRAVDDVADADASPEMKSEAQSRVKKYSDELLKLLDAVNRRGSEWGREGRWRQALAREDYSFAAQETLLRTAKGGEELTEAERDGLRERVKALEAAQARYEAKIAAMESLTREQSVDRTVREMQRPPATPRRFKAAEKIRDKLRIESGEAKKRLLAKLNQVNDITQALIDAPEVLRDSAIIGAEKIYSLGLDFAEWSAAMAEEFGPKIKPALGQIWDESKKLFYVEQKGAIVDELKKASTEDRQKQLGAFAVELARAKVEAGMKGRDEVVDAVWADLKEAIPDLTRREAMDAISGYGKFKPLSRDEITTQLRDLKGQMQQVAKLEDMAAGEAPKKTGMERRTPSDEERRLQKQVEAKKKEGGYAVTDPERQLRTAMQAVRRSLENRIKDFARELETGEKEPKPAKTPPTDPKIEALRAVADRIRETLEDVEGKPDLTPEERIERAVKSTTEAIDRLEKQLDEGKVFPDRTKTDEPWSPAISKLKKELEDLRAFRKEMQKLERPPKSPEQRALDSVKGNLKRQIVDLEKQIEKGEKTPKAKRTTALDAEAEALKARRDDLRAEFDRVFGRDGLSDEQRLNIWKAGAVKRIAELKERIADKDFEPKTRKPLPMDDEAAKLKGEVERLRQDFWIARAEAEQAKQPAWFKALRTTSNLARASALSGYHTLGKLAMFSVARFSEAPLYEAVSAALKNLPGVKPIAAKANLEAGAEMSSLAKFYVKAATRGMRDALESLDPANKGKSSLKAELGDRRINAEPVRWYDYFGILHMAEKSPLLRGDFEMRLEKVTQWSIANGLDVNDPLVAGALRKDAFDYSHRAILMENNAFATAITTFTRQLEAANPKTGKIDVTKAGLAWFLRTFVTKGIVRTPANYVVQTMARTPLGLAKGTAQLVVSHMRGIDKLTPEEANGIMRLLKVGAVGSAVFLWGAIDASKDPKDRIFGGYYQPGEKRSVDDVGFGHLRVGSVEMPHILTHNPLTEAAQMGSTFYRVMVSRVKHKGSSAAEEKGALAGAATALVSLASEAPIVSPITREVQELERGDAHKLVWDQIAGLIPMFVQNMAVDIDGNQSRRAENFEQAVEKNLPGLRDKVPLTKAQKERNVRERLKR